MLRLGGECAGLSVTAMVSTLGQGDAQGDQKAGVPKQEQQQAGSTEIWQKVWPHLFGEAYTDGEACSSPLLKGTYCRLRREEFPGALHFYTVPVGSDPLLGGLDVRMTPTKWVIDVRRDSPKAP